MTPDAQRSDPQGSDPQPSGPLRSVCIVGGGTAGWIAAAMLAHLYPGLAVTLVESDDIGTIGVGESTIPPFLELLAKLGIDEAGFVREVGASFKLGIEFRDWRRLATSYFHPFGAIGMPTGGGDFYQLWLRAAASGYDRGLQDFAPASEMARQGRFAPPGQLGDTPLGSAAYALHVDARRVVVALRRFAESRGVVRAEGVVTDVIARPDGFVDRVRLEDGRDFAADLFIDCTGFRALLTGAALDTPIHDWSHWLLCDRAIAVQTQNAGPPPPYTLAHAQSAGWRWRIPLQHRSGNGHVFSSRHMGDDEATAILLAQVEGEPVTAPMTVKFRTGVRTRPWNANVVAIGLACGFIEPLESTAIHLIYRGIDMLLRYLPDRTFAPVLRDEYNRRIVADYEEIRDFIILHYCTSARDDTTFWRECRGMELPDSLRHRIDLFRVNGGLADAAGDLFSPVSWQSVMDGMGVRPRHPHPSVAALDARDLGPRLDRAAAALAKAAAGVPAHADFIARHCAAAAPA